MERLERIQIKILGTPLEKNLHKIRCTGVHLSQTELMVSKDTYLCVGVGKKPGPLPVASQHLKGHFSQRALSSIQYPFTKIIPVNGLRATMINLCDHSLPSDHYQLNTSFLQCDINPLVGRNTMYVVCLTWMSSWTFGLS